MKEIWEIHQHIQWINGRNSFLVSQVSPSEKLNFDIRWIFRPDMAAHIGSMRLVAENENTKLFFITKPLPGKDWQEKFLEFFQLVKDYFADTIISENEELASFTPLEIAILDFTNYIKSEKRMTFWKYKDNKKIWRTSPEKHAKDLLQTFLYARFGSTITIEEVRAGAGKIDLYLLQSNNQNYIVEIKMCGLNYSRKYALRGLEQLVHYLENKETNHGILVIFDSRSRDFSRGIPKELTKDNYSIKIFVTDVRPDVKKKD